MKPVLEARLHKCDGDTMRLSQRGFGNWRFAHITFVAMENVLMISFVDAMYVGCAGSTRCPLVSPSKTVRIHRYGLTELIGLKSPIFIRPSIYDRFHVRDWEEWHLYYAKCPHKKLLHARRTSLSMTLLQSTSMKAA